jgi:hypothetical protein
MVCIDFRYYFKYFLFICFVLLVFGRYHLDAVDFDNLQDLEEQDFEQQAGEQGK